MSKILMASTEEELAPFMRDLNEDAEGRMRLGIHGTFKAKDLLEDSWGMTLYLGPYGFIKGNFSASSGQFYINKLYIVPSKRAQGFGKELVTEIVKRAKENWNVDAIYCLTLENEPVEKLLESLGFECNGVYRGFTKRSGKRIDQSFYFKKV